MSPSLHRHSHSESDECADLNGFVIVGVLAVVLGLGLWLIVTGLVR